MKAGVESSRMTLGICFGGADFFTQRTGLALVGLAVLDFPPE